MQAGQPALAWYIEIVVSCMGVTRVTSGCVSEYWLESSTLKNTAAENLIWKSVPIF